MNLNITSRYFKNLVLMAFLGLNVVSCKKDDHPDEPPVKEAVEYHQTAVTQFIHVGSVSIAYRVLGEKNGTPLIMVSSLGSSLDDWDPTITNGLAQKHEVIIFDIQGVGSSEGKTPDNIADMAKGVVAFTKALGYTKADFLGFSMGSFITQQIALSEPDLVNKMILTGTGPKGAEGLSNLPNLLAGAAGLSEEESFLKFGFTSSVASSIAGKAAYQRIHKRIENRDKALSEESSLAEVTAVLAWAQPYPDALKELKAVAQATLIVQGEHDQPLPVVNAIRMSESLPNAKLAVFEDAGHASLFQDPDQFLKLALPFLAK